VRVEKNKILRVWVLVCFFFILKRIKVERKEVRRVESGKCKRVVDV